MKLSDIQIDGIHVCRDSTFRHLGQCTITSVPKMLTFVSDEKYLGAALDNRNVSAVICREEHIHKFEHSSIGILISQDPRVTFFEIHNQLCPRDTIQESRIDSSALISRNAHISANNVIIGKDVVIEENVVIREGVSIGDRTIIRSGSIIGGQGFEFKRVNNTGILRVNHYGKIFIGNDVECKEYTTVHLAVFDWDVTIIGDHCKIDSHTHIGHATKIGDRVLIGSHCNLAGNIDVANDVYIGLGSTISNRVSIQKGARISLGSVVTKNVDPGSIVTGNFAIPHDIFMRNLKAQNI